MNDIKKIIIEEISNGFLVDRAVGDDEQCKTYFPDGSSFTEHLTGDLREKLKGCRHFEGVSKFSITLSVEEL